MSEKGRGNIAGLTDKALCDAIRYLLQLAAEWYSDEATYLDGQLVLADVVADLLKHKAKREELTRNARFVALAPYMRAQLERVRDEQPWGEPTKELERRLRELGVPVNLIVLSRMLHAEPVPEDARSFGDEMDGRLADLIGMSKSDFQKAEGVAFRGKETDGRLGNEQLFERALLDAPLPVEELLLCAFKALGIRKDAVQTWLPDLDWDALLAGVEERAKLGQVWDAGEQAKVNRKKQRAAAKAEELTKAEAQLDLQPTPTMVDTERLSPIAAAEAPTGRPAQPAKVDAPTTTSLGIDKALGRRKKPA
jgi:hypothetical protein